MPFEGTGAQILVESLCQAGLTTIFGLPGDTGVSFYDALYARRDRMRHVLARDELRQVFGAYQRTARPGFIDVVVADPTQVVPPVAPWQAALEGQGGRPVY